MSPSHPARRPSGRLALVSAALAALIAFPALAQDPGEMQRSEGAPVPRDYQIRALKEQKRIQIMKGARRHFLQAAKVAKEMRAAAKKGLPYAPGVRQRKAAADDGPLAQDNARFASPFSVQSTAAVPTNVRANNPAGETNQTQSEESIASLGSNVLVAWNDGNVMNNDWQGYAYSTDGGATFTDGGTILHPPGYASWSWSSDPVVTVNEKTGKFFYSGLANSDVTHNALGVAIGHFSGASFTWDTAIVVRSVLNSSFFLDKQWFVADSSNNTVYLTNTTFTTTTDYITFQRSTDGGIHWSAATQISDAATNGYVQGSRPVVGPGGELYVAWLGPGSGTDSQLRFRKSANQGTSFGTEIALASFFEQYGTGSPGFNRDRGINFPSITVDRTAGPNRGRIYATWNETWDIISQAFTVNSGKAEVELNNSAGTATLFTPGQTLRGTCSYNVAPSGPSDFDYFKFHLDAGQSVVFWADSLPAKTTYTMRIFAAIPDSAQRLAFGAELDSTVNVTYITEAFYSFRAPVTADYYLRMAPAYTGLSRPFRYRILTAYGNPGGARSRDQNDAFVTTSDDGANWSTPARVNDNAIGFFDFLPEVVVGPDGCPYATWFDYRDDTYGSRCHQYAARSLDGGTTWQANARFTSVASNFTTSLSNLAPNMGDYSATTADARYVRPAWADGRSTTSVDTWVTAVDTRHSLSVCPGNRDVGLNQVVNLSWTVSNLNPLFVNAYSCTLTSARNWPMPAPSTLAGVAAAGTSNLNLSFTVPDTAAGGHNQLTMTVSNQKNTYTETCLLTVNVTGPASVGPGSHVLALAPARPNPASALARVQYTLPRDGRVTLRVYGLRGELVRTLVDGERAAGVNSATWDGLDESGGAAASGAYFVRLEAFGRTLTERVVWMR
jgi:hypothetical protein